MTIKVIVFDWDGTLFDSMGYKPVNAGRAFADHYGIETDQVERLFKKHSGPPRRVLFERIAAGLKVEFSDDIYEKLSQRFTDLNFEAARTKKVFDEVPSVVAGLARRYPLYISSSSRHEELSQVVPLTGIAGHFKAFWGSRGGFSKGPGHFAKICAESNCKPGDILFVGDDDQDYEIARTSKVKFCLINRQNRDVRHLEAPAVHSLAGLMDMLY